MFALNYICLLYTSEKPEQAEESGDTEESGNAEENTGNNIENNIENTDSSTAVTDTYDAVSYTHLSHPYGVYQIAPSSTKYGKSGYTFRIRESRDGDVRTAPFS